MKSSWILPLVSARVFVLAMLVATVMCVVAPLRGQTPDTSKTLESLRAKAIAGDADAQFTLGMIYSYDALVPKDAVEAAKWYRKAAEQGRVDAQRTLAGLYAEGDGVPKDAEEALKWYRKAAENGDDFAQLSLGFMYDRGDGAAKDTAEAAKWYRKAAEQGNDLAQLFLGDAYAIGDGVSKDAAEAVKWYGKAAEQGNAKAQYKLGAIYATGDGVAKDAAEAVKWYRKAAEQGNAMAQCGLGIMYHGGWGVAKDAAEAVKWYRKAAERGNAVAQLGLGAMYATGDGVPMNDVQAYAWWNIAAAKGVADAAKKRAIIEKRMTPAQIAEAQRISAAFKPRPEQPPVDAQRDGQRADSLPDSADAYGSGFFVTQNGYVITNYHVVADARRVTVRTAKGTFPATVVQRDPANDLALLKVECTATALHIRGSRGVKIADRVSTIGYPNPAMQGLSAKFSSGEIGSINGPGDDPRFFQISVPVQPGNSGGPLVDEAGLVVGVIVAKLDQFAALKQTGQLPENVNYAIKGSLLVAFLESVPDVADKLVPLPATTPGTKVDPTVVVQPATVMVQSYK